MSQFGLNVTADEYETLRLLKHQGLSVTRVAEETGEPVGTVRNRVRRLRDRGFVQTFQGRGRTPQVTVDLRLLRHPR